MTTPMSALKQNQSQPKMATEPEEGYMSMAPPSGGYLQPRDGSMRSPNRTRTASSPRGFEMSHTGFPRSTSAGSSQDAHNLHTQLNQSSQRILSSEKSVQGPTDPGPGPYKLSAMPSYENSAADAGRYVNPGTAGHGQNGKDRSPTPEAPFYGETNQYSVIGASNKRTDSVLYGNKTASRRKRRKSEGKENRHSKNGGSLLIFIVAVLVLLSLASLGISVYVLATRTSSNESSDATTSTSPVRQSDLNQLEKRITALTSMLSAVNVQLSTLNASQQSDAVGTTQRIASNEASLARLSSLSTMHTNSIDGALSNISSLNSQLSSNTIRGLTDVYPHGILFNCSEVLRACTVTATVVESQESCDIAGFPVVIPQNYFLLGVICEANILTVNTVLSRLEVGATVEYSCNCQFRGTATPVNTYLECMTRATVCQSSGL